MTRNRKIILSLSLGLVCLLGPLHVLANGFVVRGSIKVSQDVVALTRALMESPKVIPLGLYSQSPSIVVNPSGVIDDLRLLEESRASLSPRDLAFLLRRVPDSTFRRLAYEFGVELDHPGKNLLDSVTMSILPDPEKLRIRFENAFSVPSEMIKVARVAVQRIHHALPDPTSSIGAVQIVEVGSPIEMQIREVLSISRKGLMEALEFMEGSSKQLDKAHDLKFSISEVRTDLDLLSEANRLIDELVTVQRQVDRSTLQSSPENYLKGAAPSQGSRIPKPVEEIESRPMDSQIDGLLDGITAKSVEDELSMEVAVDFRPDRPEASMAQIQNWLASSDVNIDTLTSVVWKILDFFENRAISDSEKFTNSVLAKDLRQLIARLIGQAGRLNMPLDDRLAKFRPAHLLEQGMAHSHQLFAAFAGGEKFRSLGEIHAWMQEICYKTGTTFSPSDRSTLINTMVEADRAKGVSIKFHQFVEEASLEDLLDLREFVLFDPGLDLFFLKAAVEKAGSRPELSRCFDPRFETGLEAYWAEAQLIEYKQTVDALHRDSF